MNVHFASSDPLNSVVLDSATGQFLFMVETPTPAGKDRRTTTVFDAQRQVVGVFDRNLGRDSVSVRGTTMRVGEWLPKKSSPTRDVLCCSSRLFVAPDGKEYMWKHGLCHQRLRTQLIEARTEATAAEARLHPMTQQLTLGVGPTLLPFLDMLVLLFLVCEEERHAKHTFTAAMDFITDVGLLI